MAANFQGLKIKLASPEEILSWSSGEIIRPETINYRTQRPEKDGLFSERIFGPTKDWECYCGKYRRIRFKGVICDKCGVEVTRSIVRRERMGHIKLAAPVSHIWFLRSVPSRLSLILDVPLTRLEKVIYYAAYIVVSVSEENRKKVLEALDREFKTRRKGAGRAEEEALESAADLTREALASLSPGRILTETEYHNLSRRFGDVFEAGIGAEAVRKILEKIDLEALAKKLKKELEGLKDTGKAKKIVRRLKLVASMAKSGVRPEWMIFTVLPVLPPDLRPMVPLDGGRFATSDLNDLYRRVINRNNRLKKLLDLKAPEVIVVNEKRMLQEAVDTLIDSTVRYGAQPPAAQRRPLRSLADMLKGKQGRFRQNLLGKRVDYSGRSVIVVGPNLKIDECGLPKKMALELFKPFVIGKIIERGLAYTIRNANRLVEQAGPEIWEILEETIKDRKVLLNRAPTLHRLGVQAFKPVLIEDLAIRIPPLVCHAFNADFDGDQMAVHLPLTEEAQREAREIMLASANILKPATGEPVAFPTQDIVLGCYYLTRVKPDAKGTGKAFGGLTEAESAYEAGAVGINALVKIYDSSKRAIFETSPGRIVFNAVLPADFGFINETLNKKTLTKIVAAISEKYGAKEATRVLDGVRQIGFEYASRSGVTWGMDDLTIPKAKREIVKKAEEEVNLIQNQFEEGLLTKSERRARVISVWQKARSEIEKVAPAALDPYGSVYSIIDSGARGTWEQPLQMMGMKGLVTNPRNEIIELPIKSSFKEGMSVLEFFISTHGARKGTTDTALKTSEAGYLTRRLVDVAQDVIVKEENCGVRKGLEISRSSSGVFGRSFGDQLFSRTSLESVKMGRKVVVKAGEVIDKAAAETIEKSKVDKVAVRSTIYCKTLHGICSKCYGFDLGRNEPVKIGAAVGVVAAQSIGEPGTQLTMRTFHAGGVAGVDITHGLPRVAELFEVRSPKGKAFLAEADGIVDEIEERGMLKVIKIRAAGGKKKKILEYPVGRQLKVFVKPKDKVKKGDQLCEGNVDPKELFEHRGEEEAINYIVSEVQRIYLSEGASINNKHIEVIVRQMFSRVEIKDPGETDFLAGDMVERSKFAEVNQIAKAEGKEPAKGKQLLMGITKVALSSDSFLSAASFQETSRVLVGAALESRLDELRGLKENVIIGRLIPAGTGLKSELTEEDN